MGGCRKTTMAQTTSPNMLNRGSAAALPGFIGLVTLIYLWNNGAIGMFKAPNVYAWAATGLACALMALAGGVFSEPRFGSRLLYVFSGLMIMFSAGLAIPISQPWGFFAFVGDWWF